MLYCTLAEAKAQLEADLTVDDNKLRRYITSISRRIDRLLSHRQRSFRPYFGPYDESLQWLVNGNRVITPEYTFILGAPLLDFSAVTVGSSTVTTVVEGYPQGFTPYYKLRLTDWSSWWDYSSTDGSPAYVTVTGTWGYHSDYANAWEAVDAVKDAGGINASVTTLTVADVDGDDSYGFSPRISAGDLLKIDSEYLLVTATDTGANTATIKRGVNGSTAAAHALDAVVSRWRMEEPVRHVVARQAGAMYARKGAYQVEVTTLGLVQYPPDMLRELAATLTEYTQR